MPSPDWRDQIVGAYDPTRGDRFNGGYRTLARDAAAFTRGGSDAARDPKLVDATAVIRLP